MCGPFKKNGRGALYSSAEKGHSRVVAFLLALGHNPDRPDSYGITPLQIAAWNGHCKVLQTMVKYSGNIDIADRVGHSALFKSVWKGCKICVECLIQAGANPNLKDKLGEMPLMLAAEIGGVQLMPILLQAGANPDAQNLRSETAMFIATVHGNTECVRLLLRANSNPDIQTCDGNTCLFCAVGRRLSIGALETMKILICGNANLNVQGRDMSIFGGQPMTPFEYSVQLGHLLGTWLLLEAGCDASIVQYWVETDTMPHQLHSNEGFREYLKEWVVTPPSLIRACRKVIRGSMKSLDDISKLELPNTLIDFLCFVEFDEIG